MENSNYNEIKSSKILKSSGTIRVECLTDIVCNVADIISLSATVSPKQVECLSKEARLGGRILFNIVYVLEGEVRRKELGEEFVQAVSLDYLEDVDGAKVNFCVEGVTSEKTDRLSLYGIISYDLTVEKGDKHKVLQDSPSCICDKKTAVICENLGKVSGTFTLEDEFESATIKNVLSSFSVATITACQCGIGTVICDGEIILSLSLLPMDEKNDILKEKRIIPFRLELDAPSVTVQDVAFVTVAVNKTALKVYVDEGKDKSDVCSYVTITLSGNAYKNKEIEYIGDLFSCDSELSMAKERVDGNFVYGLGAVCEKCMGKAFCDVPESARLLNVFDERVYAVNYKKENGFILVEGIVTCYALFDVDGKNISKTAELPYSVKIDCEYDVTDLECVVKEVNGKIRNGELELDATVCVTFKKSEIKTFEFISNLEETGQLQRDDSAFSLYIPQKGDTLWNVCKALKVSPQIVMEQNPQVEYPISGDEKIIIYNQIK